MASILNILQGLLILLVGVSVLDFGVALGDITSNGLGINEAVFGDSNSEWWNYITFWAYGFLGVGILQFIKGLKDE